MRLLTGCFSFWRWKRIMWLQRRWWISWQFSSIFEVIQYIARLGVFKTRYWYWWNSLYLIWEKFTGIGQRPFEEIPSMESWLYRSCWKYQQQKCSRTEGQISSDMDVGGIFPGHGWCSLHSWKSCRELGWWERRRGIAILNQKRFLGYLFSRLRWFHFSALNACSMQIPLMRSLVYA